MIYLLRKHLIVGICSLQYEFEKNEIDVGKEQEMGSFQNKGVKYKGKSHSKIDNTLTPIDNTEQANEAR